MLIYISEKKSLGKKVAKALGGGRPTNGYIDGGKWRVYFCRGHILQMLQPKDYFEEWGVWSDGNLPMIPEQWKLKPIDDVKHLLQLINDGLKTASMVINVGDADREGQLLVDEVLNYCNWEGKTKRLWFNDQSQQFITKNINNLEDNTKYAGLAKQALARSRADWLIGINSTRAYTLKAKKQGCNDLLSVGRVQTPTLALIVNRDNAIKNFSSTPFYEIHGTFKHKNGEYLGKLEIEESLNNEYGYFTNKIKANELISNLNNQGVIQDIQQKNKKIKQPLCFSKADLVEQCYEKFNYDGEKVMQIAQSLYDKHEATTYPRTDCGYLPESDHQKAPNILINLASIEAHKKSISVVDVSIKSHTWDDSKLTAHDGIRPTESVTVEKYNQMSQEEKNVFDVIITRYIAQFYKEQVLQETRFKTCVSDGVFLTKGILIIDIGWLCLYPEKTKKEQELPLVKDSDNVEVIEIKRIDKKTSPPSYFNDGNIEKAMKNIARFVEDGEAKKLLRENEGIGEESTRSSIIALLKKREYIETKNKKLVSTEKGRELIKTIKGDIKSPIKTAIMERKLKEIEQGDLTVNEYVQSQIEYTKELIQDARNANFDGFTKLQQDGINCPKCNKGILLERKSKYGKFWSCSAYKSGCTASYPNLGKKPYTDPFDCDCGDGVLAFLSGKYGDYFKCNKCAKNFKCNRNKPVIDTFVKKVKCPKCDLPLFIRKSKAKKEYFPCSGKECEFIAFKNKNGYCYNENDTWHTI